MTKYQRNIHKKLKNALNHNPVILLTGARQTGKTTLVKEIEKDLGYHYVSLDNPHDFFAAKREPLGFINELKKPVIIDEVQRVPELFLAIKYDVDNNRKPGRYILTGSANPLLIPQVGDSLAGRVAILTLYPLSQGEIHNKFENFIDTIWQSKSSLKQNYPILARKELYEKIISGGYPAILTKSWKEKRNWLNNYFITILQKDILDLSQIENIDLIPRLLALYAARCGSLLNVAELSRVSGTIAVTLHRHLALLKTLFITSSLPAWSTNMSKRIVKSSKAYLVDSGLLSLLQIITVERALEEPGVMGHVLENFVVMELKKQLTWCDAPAYLYHFRTDSALEVDIIMERLDGKVIGFEVKNSTNISQKDFKGLKFVRDTLGDKWHQGYVLYTGEQIVPLSAKISALPIQALWS